jgi:hypothetical protein
MPDRFDELVDEAERASVDGWDFSFLDGRAVEERPSWHYADSLMDRVRRCASLIDLETGGGEVLAYVLTGAGAPPRVMATEPHPPNRALADAALAPWGVEVLDVAPGAALPLPDDSVELASARHPVGTYWDELARVLAPGGQVFAQLIGPGTNRELREFMTGSAPAAPGALDGLTSSIRSSGLEPLNIREATLEVRFFDVGAVVYFLRKVIWTVPGFSVQGFRDRLVAIDEHISRHGGFLSHSRRVLVEARRPT